jgi:SAM-dependent methyltransferase
VWISVKSLIPLKVRSAVREGLTRVADLPGDLLQALSAHPRPFPPAALRSRAFGTSSRRAFKSIGAWAAGEIFRAARQEQIVREAEVRILDFGCGCGRVAASLQELWPAVSIVGVDVDEPAVAWCRDNLRGEYHVIDSDAPLAFANGAFRIVYAISVFTHMTESQQLGAVREIHRVLAPSGLFIVSTRPSLLAATMASKLPDRARQTLEREGFLFVPGRGDRFTDAVTFQSADYVQTRWERWFTMLSQRSDPSIQRDLVVLRRKETSD